MAQPQMQRRDRAVEFALPISLFLDLPLPFEPSLIVAASRQLRSRLRVDRDRSTAPIAIIAPHRAISPSPPPRDLASR